tara:strand:+ start:2619 stop:2978 length:360 start_codon:yes stop_codon:yes gene_type:complete
MNDYLAQLIAMITGSGNAMAQPGNVDQMDWLEGMTGSDEDGGTMEYLRQMNQLPEDGYSNGMPISPGDDDGVSHTLEQLIEQKMRNSGNTTIAPDSNPNSDMIRKFMYENIMKKQKDYQ